MQEELAPGEKKKEIMKEGVLDEAFKKAEISRGLRPPEKKKGKKPYEKTFPKFGILLIIFAVIGLICIYQITWAYIKYDTGEGSVEALIYKDYTGENIENQHILSLFQHPHYLGLSTDDFTNAPALTSYGFFSLIILGALITLLGVLDKFRGFSMETFVLTHFILSIATFIPGLFIVLSTMKFLGAHFLLFYNMPLISSQNNILLFFPAAFIIIIFGFIIVRIAFTVLKMDFNEMEKIKELGVSEQPFSDSTYGGVFR